MPIERQLFVYSTSSRSRIASSETCARERAGRAGWAAVSVRAPLRNACVESVRGRSFGSGGRSRDLEIRLELLLVGVQHASGRGATPGRAAVRAAWKVMLSCVKWMSAGA